MKYIKLLGMLIALVIYTCIGTPQILIQFISYWVYKNFMRLEMKIFGRYALGYPIIRYLYLLPIILSTLLWRLSYIINKVITWTLYQYNEAFDAIFKVLR